MNIFFFSLKMANQIINSLKIQNNSNLYTTQTRQQRMCNEKNWVIVWNIKNVKVSRIVFYLNSNFQISGQVFFGTHSGQVIFGRHYKFLFCKRLKVLDISFFSLKITNLIINSLKIQTNPIVYTTQTFRSIIFIFCPFFFLFFLNIPQCQQRMCNDKKWVIVWKSKMLNVHTLFLFEQQFSDHRTSFLWKTL